MPTFVKKIEGEWQQFYGEPYELMTDSQLIENDFFRLESPFIDTPQNKQFVGYDIGETDGFPYLIPTFADRDIYEVKDEMRQAVAAYRWERETGGTSFMGVPLATDDRSQLKFIGILLAVQMDPSYTVNFKTADGNFVTLNAPQIVGAVTAVRAHVQGCFNQEETLLAAINSATNLVELEAIDIYTGWPE